MICSPLVSYVPQWRPRRTVAGAILEEQSSGQKIGMGADMKDGRLHPELPVLGQPN